MSALIEVDGRLEVLRRPAGAGRLRPRGRRRRDQRPDRPQRLGQDDALQRDHRLRADPAGRGPLRRAPNHQRPARPRVQARHRPHVPADADLRAPDRAREHARRDPARARAGCAACCAARARPPSARRALELLDFVGHRAARRTSPPATSPTASASCSSSPRCSSPTRRCCCSTSRPGGVNPTLINQLADRIRELNGAGKTFLVVEHNMEFVMSLCDRSRCSARAARSSPARPRRSAPNPAVLDAYLGGEDDDGDAAASDASAALRAAPRTVAPAPDRAPAARAGSAAPSRC